ncbi:LLM class flavin-dependent oxidoreductase [Nocardia brasiliensis]|uniref:LLM class flavin-dependent oxidoreductase n=1 Tax=Nocardia brasiliensis TaxID=37326 RepID=UPI003671F7B9
MSGPASERTDPLRESSTRAGMQLAINIPNFGDFADARTVAAVAAAAEQAGWDGLFVWDHLVYDKRPGRKLGDPWMLLTAAALATSRIRLGTMITAVARRRPQQLARQVATLDRISGGRVILGVGLGGPVQEEFGSFGEATDPLVLAERLDEGLELLDRYWSGESVTHHGKHFQVEDVTLLPTPVQRPRVPIWVGGGWPKRAPMRRAARWDGAVPMFTSVPRGQAPPASEVRDLLAYVSEHRGDRQNQPFDLVVGGMLPTDSAEASDLLGPLAEAGATWWQEAGPLDAGIDQLPFVLRRIANKPPTR